MHFGVDECAQCGGVLHEYMKHAYYNTALNQFSEHMTYRPYFCSQRCADKAIGSGLREQATATFQFLSFVPRQTLGVVDPIVAKVQRPAS